MHTLKELYHNMTWHLELCLLYLIPLSQILILFRSLFLGCEDEICCAPKTFQI